MLEMYMTEDSAWSGSGPYSSAEEEEEEADYLYRKCDFHGVGRRRRQASYPRIFLKAIHMEVARRKVGDYYETEEKLTHSVAVVAKGRSRGAVEAPNERGEAEEREGILQ